MTKDRAIVRFNVMRLGRVKMITSTALTTRRMLVTVESSSPWNFILRTLVWIFHMLNHGGSNSFHVTSLVVISYM